METPRPRLRILAALLGSCLAAPGLVYADAFADFKKQGAQFVQDEKQDFAQYKR